ncbi:MAG TPA: NAD-dependent epimerase/dehydratase family protein [Candidatus Binataceae bacterium]|nr:NAD-dependent epimerase/dehydratase family protein [Candidatus Binataceae bacterium]
MILLTGASGFLGSHVSQALAARGEQVKMLVRRPERAQWLEGRGAQCVTGDLSSAAGLAAALKGCRCVIHCAALASDWGAWKDFREANDDGVGRLLKACEAISLDRFVHISTTDVYGYPDRDGLDETTPLRDRGLPYNSTKISGEQRVWAALEAGLAATIIRPGSIYGPRSVTLGREIVDYLRSGAPLIRSGRVNAGFVYVENCVDLILLAMTHPAAVGAAFNSIDEGDQSWHDYFEAICRALDLRMPRWSVPRAAAYSVGWLMELYGRTTGRTLRPLVTRTAVEIVGTRQGFSAARARQRLGFSPTIGFEEGIGRTTRWLRSQPAVVGGGTR